MNEAQYISEISTGKLPSYLLNSNHTSKHDEDSISTIHSYNTFSISRSSNGSSDSDEDLSSESSDSDKSFCDDDISYEPLYPGAPLSLHESLRSVLLLTIRHTISDSLLDDLLLLISNHCITPNHCFTSKYKFKKYFDRLRINHIRHYYCSSCHSTLLSEKANCTNCRNVANENSDNPYFISISLLSQLSAMFPRVGFFDLLKYRFSRNKPK